jgi:hypothetical protein
MTVTGAGQLKVDMFHRKQKLNSYRFAESAPDWMICTRDLKSGESANAPRIGAH